MALTADGTPIMGACGNDTTIGLILASILAGGGGLYGNRRDGVDPAIVGLQTQVQSLQSTVDTNQVSDAIGNLSTAMTSGFGDLSTQGQANNLTTLTNLNALGRDIQASANQTNLVNLNSFNQAAIANLQGFNQAQIQAQNNTNQIIAQGVAAAAKMAECCCEIKDAICKDGNMTRALINDNTIQTLRDKNTELSAKVSNNDQNQYLLATLIAHLNPSPGKA